MTIKITADFDAGNIYVLSQDGSTFDLAIRRDKDSSFYQWFYFRVDGAGGAPLTLRIINCGGSAYPGGWVQYRACVSGDNENWTRAETDYADGVLTISHVPAGDRIWFAYFAPYLLDRHAALVARAASTADVSHIVLGQTLDGRAIDLLRFGTGRLQIWLYARQHPGESMAQWWAEGAVDFFLSDDPAATQLKSAATINIIPNMNPDGSARGHLRTNAAGVNLNREWAEPTITKSPEVALVRAEMDRTGVHFAIDAHGDETIPYTFMAGFEGIPSRTERQGKLYEQFNAALAARSPDFQTQYGYSKASEGKANLSMSTNQLAERFGAVTMTLEMPFKDHSNNPDPIHGWSPERSKRLARDCMATLVGMIDDL
jgi:murein tripeptide amidase MpaA